MLKLVFLALLLSTSLFAMDSRLNNYPIEKAKYKLATIERNQDAAFDLGLFYEDKLHDDEQAIYWYEKAYGLGSSSAAYNLGLLYKNNLKQYKKAIEWYKKAYERGINAAPYAIGLVYDKIYNDYDKAIKWYTKAYDIKDMAGANALGYLYKNDLSQFDEGIKWYMKAAKNGHADAINNLGRAFREKGNNIRASAYIFAMANYGYSKDEVLDFLKNDWKIDDATIKKAYELQKTLVPNPYTGGID